MGGKHHTHGILTPQEQNVKGLFSHFAPGECHSLLLSTISNGTASAAAPPGAAVFRLCLLHPLAVSLRRFRGSFVGQPAHTDQSVGLDMAASAARLSA